MKRISLLAFFSAIFGALLVIAVPQLIPRGKGAHPAPDIKIENTPVNRAALPFAGFAPMIKKTAPAVVTIYSTRLVRERSFHSSENDPLFRQFFGDEGARPQAHRAENLGSGVVVSPDGYILTANHVVEGADEIKVDVADGKKEFTARVIGRDPPTDVAVLKIDTKGLAAITLGDSDQLEVGDVVLAIGNPFEVGRTVTMGIVSALGRGGLGLNAYEDFIQTDAAINPGNSGGALVDAQGRLVGINTAIAGSGDGGNQGIGFAVPVNMARRVMDRLISGGRITRGYLGVLPQDITPGLAEQFNLADQNGALVGDIVPNTPAEKAGIEPGDIITGFNGKMISDANSLRLSVSETAPGTKSLVTLLHQGRQKTVAIAVAELPAQPQGDRGQNLPGSPDQVAADALDGVTVTDLDRRVRRQLHIPLELHGALVTDVDPDSNSAGAGLERGDVVIQINRQPVRNAADAVELCKKATGGHILLQVWHQDGPTAGTRFLSVDNAR